MTVKDYFVAKEVSCNCGCGQQIVQPLFYAKMNMLRHNVGSPLNPTSWNRCPVHNTLSGGSDTSSHLTGWACDLSAVKPLLRFKIIYYAGLLMFRGVGIANTFIHLDDDPSKPLNRIWLY